MGLALIPQAGVAIGLAFLGQRLLPPETGNLMLTIILSSSVLYEMVGPISAKAALFLSGSIAFKKTRDKEDTEPQCPASDRSIMCEKIDVITGLDSVIEEKVEGEEAEHGELVPEIPDSECGEESGEADDSSEDCECLSDEEDTEECEESGDHDDLADSVLEELREYSEGVDERDDYDIEKEVKPVKRKKKKKQNKKNK